MNIVQTILEIVNNILTFLSVKQKNKNKELEVIHSDENKKRIDKSEEIKIRDEAENLVYQLENAKSEDEKEKILEQIRRRTSR